MSVEQYVMLTVIAACVAAVVGLVVLVLRRPAASSSNPGAAGTVKQRLSALGCAVVLLASLVVGAAGAWTQSAKPAAAAPPPRPTASVDSPVKPTDEDRGVKECAVFGGPLKGAAGFGLAVGVRKVGDSRTYFEGAVDVSAGDRFSVQLELGDDEDGHARGNNQYDIVPVFIPSGHLRDLLATNEDPNDTYWSGPGLPDGSIPGEVIRVIRTTDKGC